MNKKFAKEALIIVLLFMVIMFTIGVLFYDCLPIGGDRIKSVEYNPDESVKQALKEVQTKEGESDSLVENDNTDKVENTEEANQTYESGKKDPFEGAAVILNEEDEKVEENIPKKSTVTDEKDDKEDASREIVASDKTNTLDNKKNENTVVNQASNTTNTVEEDSSVGIFFENKYSK